MPNSFQTGLVAWDRQIKLTAQAVDRFFETERSWAKELSGLIAVFAEEFVLVHVPWVSTRGLDVLFRSDGDEYVGEDDRWSITRIQRYNRRLGKQAWHWKLQTTANPGYEMGCGPYYALSKHNTNKSGEKKPLPRARHSWTHTQFFERIVTDRTDMNWVVQMRVRFGFTETDYNRMLLEF
jgi:hypothetical protein